MAPFSQKRIPAHLKPEELVPVAKGLGRPSEYRPEYCEAVVASMAQGLSLSAFCGSIGKSKDQVYSWITLHSEFSNAVARARSKRVLWLEQKLLRSRKGAETSAAIFALRNADPTEWRDLKHTETTHLHAIAELTDAQLMAIAQGLQPNQIESQTIDVTPEQSE
jgi:hypothetical protein